MEWFFCKTKEEGGKKTAEYIRNEVNKNPSLNLCIPTGSTPVICFKEMVKMYEDKRLDLSCAYMYNMDEYVGMSKDHQEGYYRFLNQHLYSKTNTDMSRTFAPDAVATDMQAECERYTKEFYQNGVMDVIYLGIGTDGHIAFNMPKEVHCLDTHIENLSDDTVAANAQFFDGKDEVPKDAISIGIGMILKSKRIVLNAFGKSKAEVIKRLYEEKAVDPYLPATFLNLHDDVTIIVDEEASSLIDR